MLDSRQRNSMSLQTVVIQLIFGFSIGVTFFCCQPLLACCTDSSCDRGCCQSCGDTCKTCSTDCGFCCSVNTGLSCDNCGHQYDCAGNCPSIFRTCDSCGNLSDCNGHCPPSISGQSCGCNGAGVTDCSGICSIANCPSTRAQDLNIR